MSDVEWAAQPVATETTPYWQQQNEAEIRKGPRKKNLKKTGGTTKKKSKSKKRTQKTKKKAKGSKLWAMSRWVRRKLRAMAKAFKELKDPRIDRTRAHRLIDIIVIAVCAVICGADGWKSIARWGRTHLHFLSEFLALPNGIPSRDTIRRVICRLHPDEFQKCFLQWTSKLAGSKKGRLLNIDGKTLRRSGRKKSDNPLHIVSIWVSEREISLGQTTVEKKSNEITAIPKLLEMIDIDRALITIDAMGCQKEIARKIHAGNADYCLAVKENQKHLYEDICKYFEDCVLSDFEDVQYQHHRTCERGHGRREVREYYLTKAPASLRNANAWAGLKGVGMTVSYSEVDGNEQVEARYYIVSFSYRHIRRFASAVRGHWGIENSLHWIMDVTFREDESRIQNKFGASNFSWLRRFAISLLKNEPTLKDSVRGKREEAMWNTEYLSKVLIAAVEND